MCMKFATKTKSFKQTWRDMMARQFKLFPQPAPAASKAKTYLSIFFQAPWRHFKGTFEKPCQPWL